MGAFGHGIADTDEALDAIDMHRADIERVIGGKKPVAKLLARIDSDAGVLAVAAELWSRGVPMTPHLELLARHVKAELADTKRWRSPARRKAALVAFTKHIAKPPTAKREQRDVVEREPYNPIPERLRGTYDRAVEHEGTWHVQKGGKHGLLDSQFRVVIPCRFDYLDFFFDGVARARKGKHFGLVDASGRAIGPMTWDELLVFSWGLAVVKRRGRAGFIRPDGTLAIALDFDDATSFTKEGHAAVCKDGAWGIIDRDGRAVIPFMYRGLRPFHEGLAAAQFDSGKWGYIDTANRVAIKPRYARAGDFIDGRAKVRTATRLVEIERARAVQPA